MDSVWCRLDSPRSVGSMTRMFLHWIIVSCSLTVECFTLTDCMTPFVCSIWGHSFTLVDYANLSMFGCRWSFGSVLFLASWAVLMGPWTYLLHLISTPRLPFTAAYFTSIALTLVFAIKVCPKAVNLFLLSFTFLTLWVKFKSPNPSVPALRLIENLACWPAALLTWQLQSTFLTLISSILQLAALLWYLVSYFPMGGTGLRFAARVGTNRLSAWMADWWTWRRSSHHPVSRWSSPL